jgi:hypothetical protein
VPLLAGTTYVVGRILEHRPLGDHVGFLLEPVALGGGQPEDPLTLTDVEDIEPGHSA